MTTDGKIAMLEARARAGSRSARSALVGPLALFPAGQDGEFKTLAIYEEWLRGGRQTELAARLSLSVGGVARHLKRARGRLLDIMNGRLRVVPPPPDAYKAARAYLCSKSPSPDLDAMIDRQEIAVSNARAALEKSKSRLRELRRRRSGVGR